MMASLLCGVMNPCHLPESASLSHAKLWTAFWTLITFNSATCPVTTWKCIYMLSIWTRLSLVSPMGATPVQQFSNHTYWPVHFPTTQRYWSVLRRRRHQTFSPAYLCPPRDCDPLHFQFISWRRTSSNVTRRHCKALLTIAPYGWPPCCDPYWPCTWL